MKILVLGSGAREHAIITALAREEQEHVLLAAPGNAGIAAQATLVELDANDPVAVTEYALAEDVELVVIGPEAPLIAGVADELRERGIAVFGPGRAAAQLEGSKAFAKHIMDVAGVPTGAATQAATLDAAIAAIDEIGAPYVIKADGLAAGKGVIVTEDRDAAIEHARYWLTHGSGGVLIEEFLAGQEVSLFLLSDGTHVLPLQPAQDFKRALDGDQGPNTGGMGSYSPLNWLPEGFVDEVIETVGLPTIRALAAQGTPFIGLLYCGLIVTEQGIRVIEFNARFGDPETQIVLPRLVTPLSGLLFAAATGGCAGMGRPEFSEQAGVTVVLASEDYPDAPITGRVLTGLAEAEQVEGVHLAHAATQLDDEGRFIATGGRVLSVVALGDDFAQARERAYEAIGRIHLEGGQFRSDIAAKAV
ncbi:phosphoribosylamine--glycine ligase [Arenivirga flava]|uniref:Phosphoribosylamine--glycine ligase n=1 Tax=Arenivirga flava TaxID=1930060 RepID=A0AA37XBS7_9MICO|nr:phosphoribosylamine--glycine ligase [Arenivirga flava]GMA28755.1 phosphoribosylamine--glycine ligase [Arenivirga flava]